MENFQNIEQSPGNGNGNGGHPQSRLDLMSISKAAFNEEVAKLVQEREERRASGTLPPNPFDHDGWDSDITPEKSLAGFMHSKGNREISFSVVKAYAADMAKHDWKLTGEPVIFSSGVLQEAHHRFVASYLSGQSFGSYVIVSAPELENGFAYINSGKKRTPADALHIAGLNSAGRPVAAAISELALRYDAGLLGVVKQPRFRIANARDVVAYTQTHPDFLEAARFMLANYSDAVAMIRSKPAAVLFAHLVIQAYGKPCLDEFAGSFLGAQLAEDSPILAVVRRLSQPEPENQPPMAARTRLAFLNKAFLMHVAGEKMGRGRNGKVLPLIVDAQGPFPRIEKPDLSN